MKGLGLTAALCTAVEALQCARCKERDLMLGIILRYTWSILTPLQLALSSCLYHEHVVVTGSKGFTGFLDSMQFYYHCLVDEAMSRSDPEP